MSETTTATTIDVRGLPHGEREKLILPGVERLAQGEAARVIVEFNPVPLVYMLKARGEFDVSYDKEGPEEWVLSVKRVAGGDSRKEQFKGLLKELRGGEVSEETKERTRTLLREVDATTLGIMEQELIREGVSHEEIRKSLCDIHLEVLRDSLVSQRRQVSPPHPIHTLMAEHEHILATLSELGAIVERLKQSDSFEGMGEDREKLRDVSQHLIEAESHHQREEEVLFPMLEKRDIAEPPQIMRMDHVEFRKRKQELFQLAHHSEDLDFATFKARVVELGTYLTEELGSHIFKEDNILYQIALQVLLPEEWERVKELCDKIGYCCFTPQDILKEGHMVELDLRPMPPFERHDRIFEEWNALAPGETLKITNDHDPKPLHYQFEAEYQGQYEWEYDQSGPRDWVVRIKKV